MHIDVSPYRVRNRRRVSLARCPTKVADLYESPDHYESLLAEQVEKLSSRQTLLYAHDHYALLVILQGLDGAGKDGVIKHVMSGINPQGCQVFSFKQPSAEELDHDFLWRTTRCLPERGRIGVFNRSYYEEVIVVRVHPEFLVGQRLPDETRRHGDVWDGRYRSIVDFERHLHRNGTRVVKIFLHVSKEEQRERLLARLDDPEKNWKFSVKDVDERRRWPEYLQAYERCFEATSTAIAPWFVVPADDKKNARLIASQVVLDAMDALEMHAPTPDPTRRRELQDIRKRLQRRT
jgi:PPK2 family polyphosphate:nucleotide phosphotransferase